MRNANLEIMHELLIANNVWNFWNSHIGSSVS